MQCCVETRELQHSFAGNQPVIGQVSLQVPYHSIYAFLGPNGAGKTTTLRLLTGLLPKQGGEINLFGKALDKNRASLLRQTGTMIESPSIYGHLSAADNLQVWYSYFRCRDYRI